MKYRLGGVTLEALDTYVRITTCTGVRCTKRQCPKAQEVADLLYQMQGYWPNSAQLIACSRAAHDARDNKAASELAL